MHLCDGGGCAILYADVYKVVDGNLMAVCYAVCSIECMSSYGTNVYENLIGKYGGID